MPGRKRKGSRPDDVRGEIFPDAVIPAHQEWASQPSHDYWKWCPVEEGWFHIDKYKRKIWAPKRFQ